MEDNKRYILTKEQIDALLDWKEKVDALRPAFRSNYIADNPCPLPEPISVKEVSEKKREGAIKVLMNLSTESSSEDRIDALISAGYFSPTQSKEPMSKQEFIETKLRFTGHVEANTPNMEMFDLLYKGYLIGFKQ